MLPSIWREDLFADFPFGGSFFGSNKPGLNRFNADIMKTDVKDSGDSYVISMDVPGYSKEDISIKLEKGYLTITANKSSSTETNDENNGYIRKERYEGSCSRSFFVGEELTEEDIKARLTDGILNLNVPKRDMKTPEKTKYIEIQ